MEQMFQGCWKTIGRILQIVARGVSWGIFLYYTHVYIYVYIYRRKPPTGASVAMLFSWFNHRGAGQLLISSLINEHKY
ncbi:hypothetical protein BD408DRAFT_408343 [Parasitella parasitica]|nr:hypothetical protein BD408DRAFT_408343 [Parasitella parasitica]